MRHSCSRWDFTYLSSTLVLALLNLVRCCLAVATLLSLVFLIVSRKKYLITYTLLAS
ncbi:hypothetical protein AALP_AA3G279900 [Arabis alpina]|uniref:Uncharacterized protein n=1 Tax=Arabis alpina TaxID=50452 RepID=A0A087HC69_ARAAL|nr:hypothetical protein AALP_AA3G279900 [Arabis alpina]